MWSFIFVVLQSNTARKIQLYSQIANLNHAFYSVGPRTRAQPKSLMEIRKNSTTQITQQKQLPFASFPIHWSLIIRRLLYAYLLNSWSNKQYTYILYQTETLISMEFHRFQTRSFTIPHTYRQPTYNCNSSSSINI